MNKIFFRCVVKQIPYIESEQKELSVKGFSGQSLNQIMTLDYLLFIPKSKEADESILICFIINFKLVRVKLMDKKSHIPGNAMKIFLLLTLLLVAAFNSHAGEDKGPQWQPTTLSDATIKKIQQAKFNYLQCVSNEMQNKAYIKMDTRAATDKVLKKCEQSLSQIRTVFTTEKVPAAIADRYLKKTRTQTARKILEQLMFADAARKMGK